MMPGHNLVEIRGLVKSYRWNEREISVLRGADLDIRAGERISLTGPSGSGKSTFLHVLGTLDEPDAGSVKFAGRDIFHQSPAELAAFRNETIGFVFQFHHLLPEFSALENVMMPGWIHRDGGAAVEKRAKEMLELVGLSHRLDHRPGELSGGEQQRVAIARALVLGPKILLADEPTGNLDEENAQAIHDLLDEMNQKTGLTLLVVTHSSSLARRMPRRLHMADGRVMEE
jgi:lipoprotein-releasing system ATP-binding protein